MKTNKVIWGILWLFIGTVFLLENFNVIDFYWRNVWHFWPIILIIIGLNMILKYQNSNLSSYLSIAILVLSLGFLFYKGQQKPSHKYWFDHGFIDQIDINDNDNDTTQSILFEPFDGDSTKKTTLNIAGGITSFYLDGATDSLIIADISKKRGEFLLTKVKSDTANTLTFKMKDKKNHFNLGDNGNDVNFKLNKKPIWNFNVKLGASEATFDFTNYKVSNFNFDGGATTVNLTLGALLPNTNVNIKSGVTAITINIPKKSGCRIKAKTGLSSKDFNGFTKMDNGFYETENYATAQNKIFINIDAGLSSFEISRY